MTQTNAINPSALAQFYGSVEYTRHWTKRMVMTDGATFLVENGAAWFIDAVASHLPKYLKKDFQVWSIRKSSNPRFMATLFLDDQPIQNIEYTDFPFHEFPNGLSVYVQLGSLDGTNPCWVCMLPSEY